MVSTALPAASTTATAPAWQLSTCPPRSTSTSTGLLMIGSLRRLEEIGQRLAQAFARVVRAEQHVVDPQPPVFGDQHQPVGPIRICRVGKIIGDLEHLLAALVGQLAGLADRSLVW